uniref:FG-GAP-like repeat-containing protein n=1 Tax=Roseihalotalea indica TaxID=2867963 RepID=A0AA49GIH5_9BACT|nr:FG-GAP-like repeat-containing protein [Tunicatimonas sp. TK19036]
MKSIILSIIFVSVSVFSVAQSGSNEMPIDPSLTFIPDYTVQGESLEGWHVVGDAEWRAQDGELIGTANSGSGGGWLVYDSSYQDIGFHAMFKCTGGSETGILFRMEETDEGMKGVLVSIQDEVIPYQVTLDAEGKELTREQLRGAGGIWYRLAPPPPEEAEAPRGNRIPPRRAPDVELPISIPNTELRPGEWNQVEVFLDLNVIRTFLNDGSEIGGAIDENDSTQADAGIHGYGPIALYVGGSGEVRYKDIMLKDASVRVTPKEESSPDFTVQCINDMYYSWAANAADFNRDGILDIVAGPYIYYGPDYTKHREIFPAIAGGASLEFPYNRVQDTYDFDNDGWPDVLSSAFATTLYMNPKGERRHWKSYNILPGVSQSEITDFVDIDQDGKPELVYSGNGTVRYAKPNADDPTQPWDEYNVSEQGYGLSHGIGTGDINGDGRIDILNAYGWWEQPAELNHETLWEYHPVALGRYGHRARGIGGTIMAVYDANGDGLMDVVTNLNAHGFGFAWFEQRRDDQGEISFVQHMLSDDYSEESVGGITFSQPHGATFADIDQDGVQDFIVGKRYFTHLDNYYDPDPYSPPVLYWYRTVRNPDAPGGAEFVPELIHNRSGAGSEVDAVDLNNDGAVDIITSTNRGTFIYWNKK